MKNEKKLNDDILKLTMLINEQYPELLEYLSEMPITLSNVGNPKVNIDKLSDYKESLESLIKRYSKDHQKKLIISLLFRNLNPPHFLYP